MPLYSAQFNRRTDFHLLRPTQKTQINRVETTCISLQDGKYFKLQKVLVAFLEGKGS